MRDEDLPPPVAADAPLAGKTVVVTGTIADPRSGEKVARPAFQRLCERAGATTASSVSANTDMLICGANVGASKTAKAEKLGVQVVDQDEIWRMLIDAGLASSSRHERQVLAVRPVAHDQRRRRRDLVPQPRQVDQRLGHHHPRLVGEVPEPLLRRQEQPQVVHRRADEQRVDLRAARVAHRETCSPSLSPTVICSGCSLPCRCPAASTKPAIRSRAPSGSSSRPKVSAR